jgi:hypothetical protein
MQQRFSAELNESCETRESEGETKREKVKERPKERPKESETERNQTGNE